MAAAIQVGGLSWLEPSVYQAPAGTSPVPSLQVAGADTGMGAGAFGGPVYSTEPDNCCISKDRGLFDRALLCCK